MFWLDIVLLVFLGLGAALGFWSGLLWQVARVVSLGLALYATILFNEPVTQFLGEAIRGVEPRVAQGIAYVGVFLGVYLTFFLCTRLLHKAIKATDLEILDRLLGALLGTAKMSAGVAAACLGLTALALPTTDDWLAQSTLAPLFARVGERVLAMIPPEYRDRAGAEVEQMRQVLMHPAMPRRAGGEEPAELPE